MCPIKMNDYEIDFEWYESPEVLYKIIPYLQNREFFLGYSKAWNGKGQKLTPLHRCHNIQSLQYLLFEKYDIWEEINLFTSLATYKKGVRVCKETFKVIADRLDRHMSLPKYNVTIQPQVG